MSLSHARAVSSVTLLRPTSHPSHSQISLMTAAAASLRCHCTFSLFPQIRIEISMCFLDTQVLCLSSVIHCVCWIIWRYSQFVFTSWSWECFSPARTLESCHASGIHIPWFILGLFGMLYLVLYIYFILMKFCFQIPLWWSISADWIKRDQGRCHRPLCFYAPVYGMFFSCIISKFDCVL